MNNIDNEREDPHNSLGFRGIDPRLNKRIREEYFGEKPKGLELTRENFIASYDFFGFSTIDPEGHINEKKGLLRKLGIDIKSMDAEAVSNRLKEIYDSAIEGNWDY